MQANSIFSFYNIPEMQSALCLTDLALHLITEAVGEIGALALLTQDEAEIK